MTLETWLEKSRRKRYIYAEISLVYGINEPTFLYLSDVLDGNSLRPTTLRIAVCELWGVKKEPKRAATLRLTKVLRKEDYSGTFWCGCNLLMIQLNTDSFTRGSIRPALITASN